VIADDLASLHIPSQVLGLLYKQHAGSNDTVSRSLEVELGGRGDLLVSLQRRRFAEELFRNCWIADAQLRTDKGVW
jgi:hypothetical protein